jgi:hypothetical protein
MLKLPAFVRWTSRRSSAPPSEDSLEAFVSERSIARTASPEQTVRVGGRSAAAGLLAFGVLPALVIGGYALDRVMRPSEGASRVWSVEASESASGVQRVAFGPPPATSPAPVNPPVSSRPPRKPRAKTPAPVVARLPVGSPVGLEMIQGAQVTVATETPVAAPADAPPPRLLPQLVGDTYEEGKAAFEGGRYERARDTFQRVVGMIDSLPAEERQALADLRLLAAGFVDLSGAKIPPPALIEKVPALPPSAVAYIGPMAVQEDLPPWTPPTGLASRAEYVGVFRVRIGTDGRVSGTEVLEPSHAAYDAELSRAAVTWLYRPATRDGRPVPSAKDIQIRLVPR